MALRDDATLAAGHLVTLGSTAAAAGSGSWQQAWATADRLAESPGSQAASMDAAAWRRLALLRSYVQPLSPPQAAMLPLHVLPPNRLRVLSPVQGLQVATTLALRGADRAVRLVQLAALARDEDTRLALRVFVLTLLARCPAGLDHLAPADARAALEDLWADSLLLRARRAHLFGTGWRPLDAGFAVDGWDLPADLQPGQGPESRHARRSAPATPVLASAVLGPGRRGHLADAGAAATLCR